MLALGRALVVARALDTLAVVLVGVAVVWYLQVARKLAWPVVLWAVSLAWAWTGAFRAYKPCPSFRKSHT